MAAFDQQLPETDSLYSFHSFIFPFEWHTFDGKNHPSDVQTLLKNIGKKMSRFGVDWERRSSWCQPTSIPQYNEANYFYEFARNVLYDSGEDNTLQQHYYNTKAAKDCQYIITQKDGTQYQLEVDDIVLSFFETGVGIISFHLFNKKAGQSSPEDILKINALGRRVYPPFFDADINLIGKQKFFEYNDWQVGLDGCKSRNEIAHEIRIEKNGEAWVSDDFIHWVQNQRLEQEPEIIKQLIPEVVLQDIAMRPVLDDRMFTLCWYGNKDLVAEIKGKNPDTDYQSNDWWYQYVFIDGDEKTCQSKRMTQELLKKATNDRWAEYGTYYGVSRYSFVALTDHISVNEFAPVVCSHMQTIYYKIAMLGLVQRASILQFSEEIASITRQPVGERKISQMVSSLNRRYIGFINRVYFREITAQEQGIELYDMLQEQMRLPEQISGLQHEIQELHHYVQGMEEGRRNEKLDKLTYLAALFVVPSFIISYAALVAFDMKEYWYLVILSMVAGSLFTLFAILAKSRLARWFWLFWVGVLLAIIIFQHLWFVLI